ncbi:MAG: tetratricopeptide repeat protein [Anaerolineae bacterium]|nr:tetratricopeptide repeat protein [Anaerolineae bacterium]
MATNELDQLVMQANEAAEQGDWQSAVDVLKQAEKIAPDDTGVLSGLGACLLQMRLTEESAGYFKKVVDLEPDSADAFCNLGMAYSTLSRYEEAESLFKKSLSLQPDHLLARKNLAVLYVKQEDRLAEGLQILVGLLKDNPKDMESILMLASFYLLGKQYDPALKLSEYALTLEPQNAVALDLRNQINEAKQLSEEEVPAGLSNPVPTDPTRIARPEHARKLAGLKTLGAKKTQVVSQPLLADRKASIMFIGGEEYSSGVRLLTPAKAINKMGYSVKYSSKPESKDVTENDIFVFSRPHLNLDWVNTFWHCANQGKRVVLDIDEDFYNYPQTHLGLKTIGTGNPAAFEQFEKILKRADMVLASSKGLVEKYRPLCAHIVYMPSTWDADNILWHKPAPRRRTFNVGWMDFISELPNLKMVQREVVRFVKETPGALLVIGGDINVAAQFENLGDKLLFLPFVSFDDYPYLLSYFDVFISPLQNHPFNQVKPDTALMNAGARHIPWVASRIQAFEEWGEGGLFAETEKDWYLLLKRLYGDAELRKKLGTAGRAKADGRKSYNSIRENGLQMILGI